MLILTRKPKQSIVIGPDVTVTVLSVHGSQVRIGVTADIAIAVHRQEVAERIRLQAIDDAATAERESRRLR